MPNLRISSLEGRPLLDIGSYARRGPGHRDRLSPAEITHIGRTVRRTPEVMVKVLSKDSNSLRSVARHLNYIGRRGELKLETDDAERIQGKNAGQRLVEDWDLDLDQDRRDTTLTGGTGRAPKLVHKIMLSMPPGTPARGVLEAARNFAREEFALKHRYALVLHTDEPHPHVHLVVKVVSEQGERLNIRKATLRAWRSEFARQLRAQGISANATERQVRGQTTPQKHDGIYRAALRGASTHWRNRVELVSRQIDSASVSRETGRERLVQTRRDVLQGWHAVADSLQFQGDFGLARSIREFVAQMPAPETEKEYIARQLESRPARELAELPR